MKKIGNDLDTLVIFHLSRIISVILDPISIEISIISKFEAKLARD